MTNAQIATAAKAKINTHTTYEICSMWIDTDERSKHDDAAYDVLVWIEEVLEERNQDAFDEWMVAYDLDQSQTPDKFFY